jgi:hypothetical protein
MVLLDDKKENIRKINEELKSAFSQIREEFDEHLDAINENTNEIQANYEYLCEIDNKINKLNEKIEEIQLILSKLTGQKLDLKPEYYRIDPLGPEEQKMFLAIYSEDKPLSYMELAKRVGKPLTLVRSYVTNLIEKGIPINKSYVKGRPHVMIDAGFKSLQAKKNIVGINQQILGFD